MRDANCSGECPTGYYCPAGSITPLLCADGTFGAWAGLRASAQCTACSPGYVCISGQRTPCRRDSYSTRWESKSLLDCLSCPLYSVSFEAATSIDDCRCEPDRYAEPQHNGTVHCLRAPAGSDCSNYGTQLETMPLLSGYWRISRDSSDVRRCPDAFKGNASGCVGGTGDPCAEGLQGVLCQGEPAVRSPPRQPPRALCTPLGVLLFCMWCAAPCKLAFTRQAAELQISHVAARQLASMTTRTTLASRLAAIHATASPAVPTFASSWV